MKFWNRNIKVTESRRSMVARDGNGGGNWLGVMETFDFLIAQAFV